MKKLKLKDLRPADAAYLAWIAALSSGMPSFVAETLAESAWAKFRSVYFYGGDHVGWIRK